jgi:hypothetical protein
MDDNSLTPADGENALDRGKQPEVPRAGTVSRGEFLKGAGMALVPLALSGCTPETASSAPPGAPTKPEPRHPKARDKDREKTPAKQQTAGSTTPINVAVFFPKSLDVPEDLDESPFNLRAVKRTVPGSEDPIEGIIKEILKNPTEAEFDAGYFPIDTRNTRLVNSQWNEEDHTIIILFTTEGSEKIWLGPRSKEVFRRAFQESLRNYLGDPEADIKIFFEF